MSVTLSCKRPMTPPKGLSLHLQKPNSYDFSHECMNAIVQSELSIRPSAQAPEALDPVTRLPIEIPLGQNEIRFGLAWAEFQPDHHVWTDWVIRHTLPADYTILLNNMVILQSDPGRLVANLPVGNAPQIKVVGPEGPMPDGWSIDMIRLSDEASFDNEALPKAHPTRVFMPEYLAEFTTWSPDHVRWMKSTATEASYVREMSDYPTAQSAHWKQRIPLDVAVAFCNYFECGFWWTFWADVSAAAVIEIATYVRDTLSPDLYAYFEHFNEPWNGNYAAARYMYFEGMSRFGTQGPGTVSVDALSRTVTAQGVDLTTVFGVGLAENIAVGRMTYPVDLASVTSTSMQIVSYWDANYMDDLTTEPYWHTGGTQVLVQQGYAVRATLAMKSVSDIFAAAGQRDRLQCVWEGQLAGTSGLQTMSSMADIWTTPDFIDPLSVFDVVAVNPYFSSGIFKPLGGADNQFTAAARGFSDGDDLDSFGALLTEHVMGRTTYGDVGNTQSLPNIAANLKAYRTLCNALGLKLMAYEGGAHIIHSVLTNSASDQKIIASYLNWESSDRAEEVFRYWADCHLRFCDGPVMKFKFMSNVSRFGAYGLIKEYGGFTSTQMNVCAEYRSRDGWWLPWYPPHAATIPAQNWSNGDAVSIDLKDWVSVNTQKITGAVLPAGLILTGTTLHGILGPGQAGAYTFTASNAAGDTSVTLSIM